MTQNKSSLLPEISLKDYVTIVTGASSGIGAAVNTEWADLAGAALPWDEDERLQPLDLAQMALLCVTMPRRVQLEQVVLWPVCESTV